MANVSDGIWTEKTKHQEENFLLHVAQQDALNAMDVTLIKPGGLTIGNIVPVTTAVPQRFFENYDIGPGSQVNMAIKTMPRSTSMLYDLLSADLSKCSLNELVIYSALVRSVMSEFRDYDLPVPEEFEKRDRAIGREIRRAIEGQIEQLAAEEKELQKREEKREVLRQKREKLQKALE